ncbi:MAG TPA: DUF2911 domain-containing protein [Verrucomicrobiae bacterium]|nr:DUF2911 domain-containing protein [Verrucomicrobiae bacterium]
MKLSRIITSALLIAATAGFLIGQASPPKETSVEIAGKKLSIKYSAPSMRGRQIFGPGGVVSKDPTYPVWRAGANSATAFHTDADLTIGNLTVPAGNYTLFVALENPWKLIINKETGQWGLSYHADKDLGRVPMNVSKPAAPIETYKMTLAPAGGNKGKLTLEWENVVASVDFTVK